MDLSKKNNKLCLIIFISIEVLLYASFLIFDAIGLFDTTIIKYIGVISCLLFTLLYRNIKNKVTIGLIAAQVFTIISDYFLLVTGTHYILALITFFFAQVFHFITIQLINKKYNPYSLAVRSALTAIIVVVLFIINMADPLIVLALTYGVELIMNTVDSGILMFKKHNYWPLFIGFILFLGCDISVLLFNINMIFPGSISTNVINFVGVSTWAFYLPSQVLIAIQCLGDRNEK